MLLQQKTLRIIGGHTGPGYLLINFIEEINNRNLHHFPGKLFLENPAGIYSFDLDILSPQKKHINATHSN